MSRDGWVALPRGAIGLSAVCDCGISWPYSLTIIDKLEKVQRQADRFITGNYISREQGCVSQMLAELNLQPLQDRRKAKRLTFFFKVVEGLVPAMQFHDYLTPIQGKPHIKSKQYTDCVTSNINLQTIVNVLRLSSAILKHTKTHSSPGLSSTGTIWTTILCAQIQESRPSLGLANHSSSLPLHQRWKALQRTYSYSGSDIAI